MLAGIFIAVAAILYVRCDNPIVGAVLFSVGLLSCLIYHEPLCTGRVNEPWHALCEKPIAGVPRYIIWLGRWSGWMYLYALNCWFALAVGSCASLCIDVDRAVDIVQTKISHPWYWILFMGFLCGILIQAGVHAFHQKREYWPFVVLCVASFLMMGAEHCVADAAFVGMCIGRDCCGPDFSARCCELLALSGLGNLLAGLLFYKIPTAIPSKVTL